MAAGQGFKSWASLKKEAAYGTDPGGSRDGYLRLIRESLTVDKSFYQSPGLGTRIVRGLHEGTYICGGDFEVETNWEGGWLHLMRQGMGGYTFTPTTGPAGATTNCNKHFFQTAD